MLKLKRTIMLLALLVGQITACTHSIHQYHVSDFSPVNKKKGKVVRASTEQFVILGFVTQTDYVEKTYNKLQGRCRKGDLKGITTEWMTHHGFFSWTNEVIMTGLCVM